jgi:hypothetical protein
MGMKSLKKSYEVSNSIMYRSSVEALTELMELDGRTEVVKVTPKDYKLSNGVDYCSVGLKTINGDYLLQAYGKEAIQLHERASLIVDRPMMLVSNAKWLPLDSI